MSSRSATTPGSEFLLSPRAAERRSPLLGVLVLVAILVVYVAVLFEFGPEKALMAAAIGSVFFASTLVLEIGIAITLLSMLLSPELSTGTDLASIRIRLSDILLPLLLFAWVGRHALGIDRRHAFVDPIQLWLAAFLGVQLAASFNGWRVGILDPLSALSVIAKNLQFFVIFYFLSQYVHTERRALNVLRVAVGAALITALYNFTQIPSTEIWTLRRISAPFETSPEPSTIGGYFVLVIAILAALALEAEDSSTRNRLWFLAAVLFIPFLFTLSRTSYLSFMLMAIVLTVIRRSSISFLVLVLLFAASPFLLPDAVIDRVMSTFNDRIKVFGFLDRSFGERLGIWFKVYWNMRESPILGKGVTFHNVIDSYYARVLIETGLLGLLTFGLIVRRLFAMAHHVRVDARSWWVRGLALGYTAALCGLLVHGLSAITFVILRIMEPFWAISGIIAGLYSMRHDEAAPPPDPSSPEPAADDPTPPLHSALPIARTERTT